MFYRIILSLFGLVGAAYVLGVCVAYGKNRFGPFHPLVLLFLLALVDVFVPAILWAAFGIRNPYLWAKPLSYEDVTIGVAYYSVGYLLLFCGFVACTNPDWSWEQKTVWKIKRNMFWFLAACLLALSLLELWSQISDYGSVEKWFWYKLRVRWEGKLREQPWPSIWAQVLSYIPCRPLFNLVVLVGFFHRYEMRKPVVLGLFLPLTAVALAMTTFYRGSILVLMVGFAFVEFMRLRPQGFYSHGQHVRRGAGRLRVIHFVLAGVLLFVVYGAVRRYFGAMAWHAKADQAEAVYVYRFWAHGSGLFGVSSIIRDYREEVPLLGGKTYIDTLLLPVPRFIYTSKPEWYGISDITRAMGWPKSTQSAVTIPGEAFANFGWLGVLLPSLFGVLLAQFYILCSRSKAYLLFLYPGVILYMLVITNWMSSSGIMSQFSNLVCSIFILRALFGRSETLQAVESYAR